jgi:ligand-binding SRPBCC domain-containing protein
MGKLVFVAFDGNDPNGTPLGELTDAFDKIYSAEHDDLGLGSFTINRHSSQLEWCRADRYIKVYLDETEGDPVGAFWVTQSGDTVVSPEEEGGDDFKRDGLGPMLYLAEAIVWYTNTTSNDSAIPGDDAYWHWDNIANVHAGGIMVRMLEEAQARGCLPDLTYDFTRQQDSNGTPWSLEITDFQLPVGMNLLEVLRKVQETGVEFRMDPDLTLHAYEPGTLGDDLSGSITLSKAVDIATSAERQVAASPLKSTILMKGKRSDNGEVAWIGWSPAEAIAETGRRKEGFIDAPETTGGDALRAMAQTQIDRDLRRKVGPTQIGVIATEGKMPFVDYRESDVVTVDVPGIFDEVAKQVTSLTLQETESGEYDVILGFDEDPGRDGTPPTDGGVNGTTPGSGPRPCNDCPPDGPFVPEPEPGTAAVSAVLLGPSNGPGRLSYPWIVWYGTGDTPPAGYATEPLTGPIEYTYRNVGGTTIMPAGLRFLAAATGVTVEFKASMAEVWRGGDGNIIFTLRRNGAVIWSEVFGQSAGLYYVSRTVDEELTGLAFAAGDVLEGEVSWTIGGIPVKVPAGTDGGWLRVNGTAADVDIVNAPSAGQVVGESLIVTDADETSYATNYAYLPRSLQVLAEGVHVAILEVDPAAGTWELAEPLPIGTRLTLIYQAAAGTDLGTGNNPFVPAYSPLIPYPLLGTGGDGSGDNVLHDDGTWRAPEPEAIDGEPIDWATVRTERVANIYGTVGDVNLSDGTVTDGGGSQTFTTTPEAANDGDHTTNARRASHAGGPCTAILRTDLGSAVEVEAMTVVGGSGASGGNYSAVEWAVESSPDGTTWTPRPATYDYSTVDTTRGVTNITLDAPATARYWRITHSLASTGFHSHLWVGTWAIGGAVVTDAEWEPAEEASDADDATFALADGDIGDAVYRLALEEPRDIGRMRFLVAYDAAGSVELELYGGNEEDRSDEVLLDTLAITATGGWADDEVAVALDLDAPLSYFWLVTTDPIPRLHSWEAYVLSGDDRVSDHIEDADDAHDASAISYDPTSSGLTATDVQAAIDELAAAPGGGEDTSYAEVAATGAAETVDCSVARTYDLTFDQNCTLTLTGSVDEETHYLTILIRESGAGDWDLTWPGSVTWKGTPVVLTTSDVQIVNLLSVDGGTNWIATAGATATLVADLDDLTDVVITSPAEGHEIRYRSGSWVNETPGAGPDFSGLMLVDGGSPTYDTSDPDVVEVTVATVWGIGTDPYYDAGGAATGEEAALYWDPANSTYVLVPFDF